MIWMANLKKINTIYQTIRLKVVFYSYFLYLVRWLKF